MGFVIAPLLMFGVVRVSWFQLGERHFGSRTYLAPLSPSRNTRPFDTR
jgi:hypothetical protein